MTNVGRLLVGLLPLVVACSEGTEGAPGQAYTYTKTCVKTVCDSCRDDISAACGDCYDLCRSSSDVSCLSTCKSICRSDCSVCSNPTSCDQWQVSLPEPELDASLYDKCDASRRACFPEQDDSVCVFFAHVLEPSAAAYFECRATKGCDASDCKGAAVTGTLGTEYCTRLTSCSEPCEDFDTSWFNTIEPTLRPELVKSFRQCMAESTCAAFESCGAAHAALLHGAP